MPGGTLTELRERQRTGTLFGGESQLLNRHYLRTDTIIVELILSQASSPSISTAERVHDGTGPIRSCTEFTEAHDIYTEEQSLKLSTTCTGGTAMDKVPIGSRAIGSGEKVFLIAESGINHDGDVDRAHQLIDVAADAGVDAVKFQTHLAEAEMLNVSDSAVYLNESLFELIRRMELTFDEHIELKAHAERRGLVFLSTPFSREAVDLLEKVGVAAYKVGSGELTNLPLLGYIARTGKPMLVSTGMSDLAEIATSVGFIKARRVPLAVFQCTTQYPAPPEMMHLGVIQQYAERFDVPVGLSDHSQGNYMSFAAVALGARMIERHFTVSRSWPGPDQQASLEPAELADLVRGVRRIEIALDAEKKASAPERELQLLFRESVVTVRPVKKGAVLIRDDVWVKRPGYGIPAARLDETIGRTVVRELKAGEVVRWEDLG